MAEPTLAASQKPDKRRKEASTAARSQALLSWLSMRVHWVEGDSEFSLPRSAWEEVKQILDEAILSDKTLRTKRMDVTLRPDLYPPSTAWPIRRAECSTKGRRAS